MIAGITAALDAGTCSPDAVALEARKHAAAAGGSRGPAPARRARPRCQRARGDHAAAAARAAAADGRPAPSVAAYDQLLARPGGKEARDGARRDELTDTAADAAIDTACRVLRLPTIRDRHGEVAAAAARQQAGDKGFLTELLSLECDDREMRRKTRLVREAGFPRAKRLEDFDFAANPDVPAALIATLARCPWVAAGQPLVPDRGFRHRQVPPADRAGHRRRRARLPGQVRHRRRAGQRARRGRR